MYHRSNNGTSHMEAQFKSFFSGYEAFTFPFPVAMVKDLPRLSTLPASQHSKEYRAAVRTLVELIHKKAAPKLVDGTHATGGLLAHLIEEWADNINVPIGNFMGNSAAALLDHILFKEVGRVVVLYEKEMSTIKIPWVERDILALHEKTLKGLVGGLPDRLRGAIEHAVKARLDKHIKENRDFSLASVANILALFNSTVASNFSSLTPKGLPASEPEEIEKVVNTALTAFADAVRRALLLGREVAISESNAPGWSAGEAALKETLEGLRARVYRRNGVREAVRLLHLCSEFLKDGEAEGLVKANVSTTKFEEEFSAFDQRCGEEARRKAKAYIFENQTAAHPLAPSVAATVEAETNAQIAKYVGKAHLRRRAILDFVKCAAHAGLPLEADALDACALSAVKRCRGDNGETLCTITEEIEAVLKRIGGVNVAQSEQVCMEEANRVLAAYRQRAEMWWMLDSSSSWHSLARLKPLLERDWKIGNCRGPSARSDARLALYAQAEAELNKMCGQRSYVVDLALLGCWSICVLGTLYCLTRLCEKANLEDPHKESKRRSQQMWCSCALSLVLLQALFVALVLSVLAPQDVWRLQVYFIYYTRARS